MSPRKGSHFRLLWSSRGLAPQQGPMGAPAPPEARPGLPRPGGRCWPSFLLINSQGCAAPVSVLFRTLRHPQPQVGWHPVPPTSRQPQELGSQGWGRPAGTLDPTFALPGPRLGRHTSGLRSQRLDSLPSCGRTLWLGPVCCPHNWLCDMRVQGFAQMRVQLCSLGHIPGSGLPGHVTDSLTTT